MIGNEQELELPRPSNDYAPPPLYPTVLTPPSQPQLNLWEDPRFAFTPLSLMDPRWRQVCSLNQRQVLITYSIVLSTAATTAVCV